LQNPESEAVKIDKEKFFSKINHIQKIKINGKIDKEIPI